jgi:hypothetical protein
MAQKPPSSNAKMFRVGSRKRQKIAHPVQLAVQRWPTRLLTDLRNKDYSVA